MFAMEDEEKDPRELQRILNKSYRWLNLKTLSLRCFLSRIVNFYVDKAIKTVMKTLGDESLLVI